MVVGSLRTSDCGNLMLAAVSPAPPGVATQVATRGTFPRENHLKPLLFLLCPHAARILISSNFCVITLQDFDQKSNTGRTATPSLNSSFRLALTHNKLYSESIPKKVGNSIHQQVPDVFVGTSIFIMLLFITWLYW